MRLNQVEWAQAQDLLVRLAQVLTPLATGSSVCKELNLAGRLFVSSFEEPALSSHSFRLLTTLQLASTEMGALIKKLPEEGQSSLSTPVKKEENKLTETIPLSSQAKKLVGQVRESIRFLSSGGNLFEPKSAPLRETFSHLKPLIDQFIKEVHQGKIELPENARPSVAKSSRETLLNGSILKSDKNFSLPNPLSNRKTHLVQEGESEVRKTERTSALAAPYLSGALNFISSKRKKRKKKDPKSESEEDPKP